MSFILVGVLFAGFGGLALAMNLRRRRRPLESWFAFVAIKVAPPVGLCVFGVAVAWTSDDVHRVRTGNIRLHQAQV